MGQQQSSEEGKRPERAHRTAASQAERERRVNRRPSIPVLSHGRASPAETSASTASAIAHTNHTQVQRPNLQQYLASTSPDVAASGAVGRSSSRGSANRRDIEHRPKEPSQISVPVPSGPMDVPSNSKGKSDEFPDEATYNQSRYGGTIRRPPRLPLPIAGAIPESPTLQPVDKGNEDVSLMEVEGTLSAGGSTVKRRDSMLSTTTQDEDEMRDELQPYAVETSGQMVPTFIQWNQSGEKVYVTGTFAAWEKKYKLHHNKDGTRGMSTTIQLPPGTHHLKFIVDGEMRYSQDMPTAVDLNNVLVNYIEISPEQMRTRRESSQKPSKNIIFPAHPPLVPEEQDVYLSGDETPGEFEAAEEPEEEEIPVGDFRQIIPQYLIDMELPEEDPLGQRATQIINDAQGPPILPMFLGRSILNGNLPMKDDSSVLTLPNHTVLNHLATSSVRNGVLATSVTTRYKKKYVTTIMYKPVPTHRPVEG